MGIGLIDYMNDRMDELKDELVRRGEEKTEDFKDFFDDLIENIPALHGNDDVEELWREPGEEEEPGYFERLIEDLNIRGTVNDILESIGLVSPDQISEMKIRIERLTRAVENIET